MTQTFTQIIERISHWQLSQEERAAIFGVESQLRGLEYAITINSKKLAAHIARITQAHTNLATELAKLTSEVRGGKPDTTAYDFLADQMTELKQSLGEELERQRQRDLDAAKEDDGSDLLLDLQGELNDQIAGVIGLLESHTDQLSATYETMASMTKRIEALEQKRTPRRATTRKKAS